MTQTPHRTPDVRDIVRVQYGAECFRRVNDRLEYLYRGLSRRYWVLTCGALGLPIDTTVPDILVVHSLYTRPQAVHTSGSTVIIVDQSLGQLFNNLTRLELSQSDPNIVLAFTARLLGQRAFIAGELRRAVRLGFLGRVYARRAAATSAEVIEDDALQLRRLSLATYQEQFALAHELAHEGIRLASHRGQRTPVAEGARETLREAASQFQELAPKAFGAAAPQASPDSAMVRELDRLGDSDDLAQEVACDYLGAIIATSVIAGRDHAAALAAAGLGLAHLEILQLADVYVRPQDDTNPSTFIMESVLRAFCMQQNVASDLQGSARLDTDRRLPRVEDFLQASERLGASELVARANTAMRIVLDALGRIEGQDDEFDEYIDTMSSQPAILREWLQEPLAEDLGKPSILYTSEQRARILSGMKIVEEKGRHLFDND